MESASPSMGTEGRAEALAAAPKVGTLMTEQVVTLDQDQPIQEAINLFAGREFRHIPVLEGRRLAGILSDRDVLRAFARVQDHATPIRAIMRGTPHTIGIDTPVVDAIRLLLTHRINCLPVVDTADALLGILTTTDLLHAMLKLHAAPA